VETNDPYIGPIDQPRHGIPPLADGEPIPPAVPIVDSLHEHLVSVEDSINNIRTGVLVTGALTAVALILSLIVGGLYLAQHSSIHQLQAQQTASDTERARVDAIQRDATCTVINGLRATNSTALRDSWTTGHGDYDRLFAQLNLGAVKLNCE
jgi:hypothetical protein